MAPFVITGNSLLHSGRITTEL